MPVSKAQQKAVHKYVKNNYDRMELTMPKGKKDAIKAHATERGESVNGFVNRAIDEAVERDNATVEATEGGTPNEQP
ncbi:MAG: ABC transporter ATP-binding protein [Clostridiales bacterium]|nr:ABC transporter ATP-binding protein [Clostridiales bacterium]